ncbi:MAG: DUF1294 domain-containing protein [Clostridia bacterium]|nr:DUF1294 domain-containing protein [Clostridia bacterium]
MFGLGVFECYLILINLVGLLLTALNVWLRRGPFGGPLDIPVMIVTVAGGSLGTVLGILLLDRRAFKGNMMIRVLACAALVIHLLIVLYIKLGDHEGFSLKIWELFEGRSWLLIYLAAINVITIVMYGMDKLAAMSNRRRTRIVTLLLLAAAGGSIGALIAMYAFRHKTRQNYFVIGIPAIILAQLALMLFVLNMA